MTNGLTPLLVGARGYTHATWRGAFYPEDLPSEWRFLFYSHRYPALLMPARAWGPDPARLAAFSEDAPGDFRMVLEVSEAHLARVAQVAAWPHPVVAGCLVRLRRLEAVHKGPLAALAQVLPVAADIRTCPAGCRAALAALGVGVCGRPGQGRPPAGPFAVSLVDRIDRRTLGAALQGLAAVEAKAGSALFFCDPATALSGVEEALLLADLLA
ncbi:hypothetical protein [Acidiferrobacter sp.]|uniref:hypothetical protein n=1 Tax=Acidiferrobacter sp. TaxID=1872107 RepID=UPI00260A51FC|nr:hypothetical protein [Acidiferrobacter sp.]